MADMSDMADEIQESMGRSYGTPDIDESDLQAELDALGDDIMADNDTSFLDDIDVPSAPDKEPGQETVKDGLPVDEFGLPQMTS